MLAWRGGKRRLIREQKARRKLEGVFKAAAKVSKPIPKNPARSRAPATVEALGKQFSALRTRPTPPDGQNLSSEDMRSNGRPDFSASAAAQPTSKNFRALPAFPSLSRAGRNGVSLDILAIQGSSRPITTVFKSPALAAEDKEEISNENNVALAMKDPLPQEKNPVALAPSSQSKQVSDKSSPLFKRRSEQ